MLWNFEKFKKDLTFTSYLNLLRRSVVGRNSCFWYFVRWDTVHNRMSQI